MNILEVITNLWYQFLGLLSSFTLTSAIDVLLVSFIIYNFIKLIRETRAEQLVKGILILLIVWSAANLFDLQMMKTILSYVFNFSVIALMIVFQPEVRRALEQMGRSGLRKGFGLVQKEEDLEKEGYNIFLDTKYKGDIYLYDSERDSFMMALKALGYSMNTENEDELNEAYEWLLQCVETMEPEIVTDEIIDNMAQGRKALGLIYSGDAAYVMSENENMGFYMPETGTNLWSDAMVIPKNAENPELANAFINYVCTYEAAMDNSSFVGYTSPNEEVMNELSGPGGDFEGINAYIPRTDNKNDEVFKYDAKTRTIIAELFSKVKVAASNA